MILIVKNQNWKSQVGRNGKKIEEGPTLLPIRIASPLSKKKKKNDVSLLYIITIISIYLKLCLKFVKICQENKNHKSAKHIYKYITMSEITEHHELEL